MLDTINVFASKQEKHLFLVAVFSLNPQLSFARASLEPLAVGPYCPPLAPLDIDFLKMKKSAFY